MRECLSPRALRRLIAVTAAVMLAGCVPGGPPTELAALPPEVPPARVVAPPPPPPLQIVNPPVQPGSAVAVVRGAEPRPVVLFQQPDRISPPGTPLVLPPPIPRGERQETLVEGVPARILVGRGAAGRRQLVAALGAAGGGRFDALHLEVRGADRRAVAAVVAAARRAGVDPLKVRAVRASVDGGAVEVIATRFVATAPVCPSLAVIGPSANDNDFEPTLGCSGRRNLAAMVNDPSDLLANDAVVPGDGAHAAGVIERYRTPSANGRGGGRQDGYGQAPQDPAFAFGPPGGVVLGAGGAISR